MTAVPVFSDSPCVQYQYHGGMQWLGKIKFGPIIFCPKTGNPHGKGGWNHDIVIIRWNLLTLCQLLIRQPNKAPEKKNFKMPKSDFPTFPDISGHFRTFPVVPDISGRSGNVGLRREMSGSGCLACLPTGTLPRVEQIDDSFLATRPFVPSSGSLLFLPKNIEIYCITRMCRYYYVIFLDF